MTKEEAEKVLECPVCMEAVETEEELPCGCKKWECSRKNIARCSEEQMQADFNRLQQLPVSGNWSCDNVNFGCPSDVNYCCSVHGWCGSSAAHCCRDCVDYRRKAVGPYTGIQHGV